MKSKVPLKIVVIGGGTGNSTVIRGLKYWIGDGLSAIVSTFDDGGGAGKLREEYTDLLALGDLNQCLMALSNSPQEELALLKHRFFEGSKDGTLGLHGQTLGNLIMTAASQSNGGNITDALSLVGRMFNITGRLLPASEDNRHLIFRLPNGTIINGEHNAETTEIPSFSGANITFDIEPTRISPDARDVIEQADMVVLAPGDLYTSIAPNLVVPGMKEALQKANAVVLVCNLMNRNRHTVSYTALDYAQEYERLIGDHVIDRVLYNTEALDETSLKEQESGGSFPVVADPVRLAEAGFKAVGKDLLSSEKVIINEHDALGSTRSTIRHDSDKVALALMSVYFNDGFGSRSHAASK